MSEDKKMPAEGELYHVFIVAGHTIPVYYGYIDEGDKKSETTPGEHILPVTPDFLKEPLYDENGYPLVTDIQNTCEYYEPEDPDDSWDWCRDCRYFPKEKPKIGVCECHARASPKQAKAK